MPYFLLEAKDNIKKEIQICLLNVNSLLERIQRDKSHANFIEIKTVLGNDCLIQLMAGD